MNFIDKMIKWTYNNAISYHHYSNNTQPPSDMEIEEFKRKLKRFEQTIDVKEFKEMIMQYTQTMCGFLELGDAFDIDKLVESGYDNYLARLHQMVKYINKKPSSTNEYYISLQLKMEYTNISEYYPLLNSLIVFADECAKSRMLCNASEKTKLNKDIHMSIYNYAQKIYPHVKQIYIDSKDELDAEKATSLATSLATSNTNLSTRFGTSHNVFQPSVLGNIQNKSFGPSTKTYAYDDCYDSQNPYSM